MKYSFNKSQMMGLGDVVEAITTVTGIKAATEAVSKVTGKDCGCNKRRESLNKKFPFRKGGSDAD